MLHSDRHPDISVIIAVYNAERFLRGCLDAVTAQTLENIEIICVNDGSTDGSQQILEEYAGRDGRIRLIRQSNAGAGCARNTGMACARGDYLSFLDADDVFHPDMLRRALCHARKADADLCIFRSCQHSEKTGLEQETPWTLKVHLLPDCQPFSPEDAAPSLFQFCMGWAWDKLFRTEWIRKEGIRFPELRNSEDMFFVFTALFKAKRICWLDDVLVTQRTDVGTSLSNSRNKAPFCFYDCLVMLRKELEKAGCWIAYESSYVDWVLEFTSWNIKTLDVRARQQVRERLRREGLRELGIEQAVRNGHYNRKWETSVENIFGICSSLRNDPIIKEGMNPGWRRLRESMFSVRREGWMKLVRVFGFRFRLIRKKKLMADWDGLTNRVTEMQSRTVDWQKAVQEDQEKLMSRASLVEESCHEAEMRVGQLQHALSELEDEHRTDRAAIRLHQERMAAIECHAERLEQIVVQDCKDVRNAAEKIRAEVNLLYKHLAYPEHGRKQRDAWALMSYNYAGDDYYDCDCVNLGDYIQSLAARQYLPNIDAFIPRDEIAYYSGRPVNMIMNGWWWVCPGVDELSERITPLFVAYHVNNPEKLTSSMLAYLKRNEPVGCRDLSTQKILLSHGIKAYFSGCMTLTLGRNRQWKGGNGRILCCDFDLSDDTPLARYLHETLGEAYNLHDVDSCTQLTALETSQEERFGAAESLLDQYRQASLVLTTRIHCALPCLGMGVPVILVVPRYDHLRFDGLVDLLNRVVLHEDGRIESHLCLQHDTAGSDAQVRNPEDYRIYRDLLEDRLRTAFPCMGCVVPNAGESA